MLHDVFSSSPTRSVHEHVRTRAFSTVRPSSAPTVYAGNVEDERSRLTVPAYDHLRCVEIYTAPHRCLPPERSTRHHRHPPSFAWLSRLRQRSCGAIAGAPLSYEVSYISSHRAWSARLRYAPAAPALFPVPGPARPPPRCICPPSLQLGSFHPP
ncbi:hypothetical protein FIBSPDRAFT_952686 [Athelia psychrophila]|uniref:Uncharacterized protein n=1 Tax=Athelia psychrophila TaxID=1759441 RepID=A0A166L4H6_9AGAM|nr:hypothetical protein FIBSPDRAFT_952686 [Fibularhizoctonia sp. CBS 109695]